MKTVELLFKYDDLKLDVETVNAELPAAVAQESLGKLVGPLGYWVDEPIQVSGSLYRTESDEVIADLALSGAARFICVSCGAEETLPIKIREGIIIVPQKHEIAQETDVSCEGEVEISPDIYTFEGSEIDLAEMIHELLVLNAPRHPRCADAGGQCGVSIAERESDELPDMPDIDPRWAPLLALQEGLESSDESD